MTGIIYKGIGGFYYVKTADGNMVECKPRGLFRKQKIKPVPGDNVRLASEADTLYIDEILPRRNVFVRPPVANVDQLIVLASTVQPVPSFLVIDKLFVVAVDAGVKPILVITKSDLAAPDALCAAYAKSDIPVFVVDALQGEGVSALAERLAGQLSVLCGNSGVGKSTLLNALLPQAERTTGEISEKLGRGRHMTREVEIFEVGQGLVADTPGFASYDLQRAAPILKENLQLAFPEMARRMPNCRFSGCTHLAEPGCAVLAAVAAGDIAQSRYDSYVTLYEEARHAEP